MTYETTKIAIVRVNANLTKLNQTFARASFASGDTIRHQPPSPLAAVAVLASRARDASPVIT